MSVSAQTTPRLTISQAARAFKVTTMTIYMWRKGSTSKTPLPVEIDEPKAAKPRVFVPIAPAVEWARAHGLHFSLPKDCDPGIASKPGPKPKARRSRKAQERH